MPAEGRHVPMPRAVMLCFRVLIRQVFTWGRLAVLGSLGLVVVALAGYTGRNTAGHITDADMLGQGARIADNIGLVFLVPIVALVFASSVLGDIKEDGTLVYLWMRPIGRGPLAVGAAAAALALTLPLTAVPVAAAGWLAAGAASVDGSTGLLWAGMASAAMGATFYVAIFMLLGLLVRRAIMFGIGYLLFWEGIATGFGSYAYIYNLSPLSYTRSLMTRLSGVELTGNPHSVAQALVVLGLLAALLTVLSGIRIKRMEVA